MHCGYFYTTRKVIHSSFLTPTAVSGRCSLSSDVCVQSDPRFEKRRLRQISAYNVSTVRHSEIKFNYNEYKINRGLSRSAYVTPKSRKGDSKSDFFRFCNKSELQSNKDWKHVLDFLFAILNLFAISYGWDVMSGNLSKSAFSKGWVTWRPNFRLKCYFWREYLWTIRWGNDRTTTMPSFANQSQYRNSCLKTFTLQLTMESS